MQAFLSGADFEVHYLTFGKGLEPVHRNRREVHEHIFAAFLLTFIPSAGDYVNAAILGSTNTTMIGTVIQGLYLGPIANYPMASALSVILMAGLLIGIIAYAKVLGADSIGDYI